MTLRLGVSCPTQLQEYLVVEIVRFGLQSATDVVFRFEGIQEAVIKCNVGAITIFLYSDSFEFTAPEGAARMEAEDLRSDITPTQQFTSQLLRIYEMSRQSEPRMER